MTQGLYDDDVSDFVNDFHLMIHNCQTFYSPESDPFRMSVELSSYFDLLMNGILGEQQTPPTRKRIDWTDEEDEKLKRLVLKHGRKWSTILKHFPDKTVASCRTRTSMLNLEGMHRCELQQRFLPFELRFIYHRL